MTILGSSLSSSPIRSVGVTFSRALALPILSRLDSRAIPTAAAALLARALLALVWLLEFAIDLVGRDIDTGAAFVSCPSARRSRRAVRSAIAADALLARSSFACAASALPADRV